jgi:hypothetical protein
MMKLITISIVHASKEHVNLLEFNVYHKKPLHHGTYAFLMANC